jgi:hypothetical protein
MKDFENELVAPDSLFWSADFMQRIQERAKLRAEQAQAKHE